MQTLNYCDRFFSAQAKGPLVLKQLLSSISPYSPFQTSLQIFQSYLILGIGNIPSVREKEEEHRKPS